MAEFLCNQEIVEAARRNLPREIWNHISGAAQSETTLRRNRYALDSLAFLPRVLRDVSRVDCATEALGHKLRMPVLLAPMGSMQMMTPDGAIAAANAAGRFGTLQMVSSMVREELEKVCEAGGGPKILQLYIRGDMDWIAGQLRRAKEAGFAALALTVDSPWPGIRERNLLARWQSPVVANLDKRGFQAAITWDTVGRIREVWEGAMILKGIGTASDARLAVEHGIEVVYVSNHGGRELDHQRGAVDILPEVVEAVAGAAEVWIDGGFVRGTDVVKALALGARTVGIGRLQAWALAAGGEDALVRALEILEAEVANTMALIGVTEIPQLHRDYLARVTPMGPCHETSAFSHLGPEPLR